MLARGAGRADRTDTDAEVEWLTGAVSVPAPTSATTQKSIAPPDAAAFATTGMRFDAPDSVVGLLLRFASASMRPWYGRG